MRTTDYATRFGRATKRHIAEKRNGKREERFATETEHTRMAYHFRRRIISSNKAYTAYFYNLFSMLYSVTGARIRLVQFTTVHNTRKPVVPKHIKHRDQPFTCGNLSSMPAVWIHSQPTILRSTSVSKSSPSIMDGVDVSFSLGSNTLLNVNSTLVGCFRMWRSWFTSVAAFVAVSILHITRASERSNENPATRTSTTYNSTRISAAAVGQT